MTVHNQKGVSLVELLIIVGMISGVILVSSTLMKMSTKGLVQKNVESDAQQIVNEITRTLSDPARCELALGGVNAVLSGTGDVTSINSKFVSRVTDPSASFGTSSLAIDNYQMVTPLAELLATQTANLVISFVTKSIMKTSGSSPSTFKKKIQVSVIVDGSRNITSCRVVDTNKGEGFWSRTSGEDIYYEGNVGVGISSPDSLFDIQGALLSSAGALPASLLVTGARNVVGEGAPLLLKAGDSSEGGGSGTGGRIRLLGGLPASGGSVYIDAGVNGNAGPGTVTITGARSEVSPYVGGNVELNGGAPGDVSVLAGNVILADQRGKVAMGANTPVDEAPLTVNGAIDTNNSFFLIGNTSGNSRGTRAIDIQNSRNAANKVSGGNVTVTIGSNNNGGGNGVVAIGDSNNCMSNYPGSAAVGYNNNLQGSWNFALGISNSSAHAFDTALLFGEGNVSNYHEAALLGKNNSTSGFDQQWFVVAGLNNRCYGNRSICIGKDLTNYVVRGLQLGMSNSGKTTILQTGLIGIGKENPTTALDVVGNIQTSGCYYYNSSVLGTCASDGRIKKDVHHFTVGLETLLGLNPVMFKYNGLAGFENDNKEKIGLIAQQVERVGTSLVKEIEVKLHEKDSKGTVLKGVDYGALIYVAINSIKDFYMKWISKKSDLMRDISELKNEISVLRNELMALKKINERNQMRIQRMKQRIYSRSVFLNKSK